MLAISTSTAAKFSSDGDGTGATSFTDLPLWRLIDFLRMLDFPSSKLYKGARAPLFAAVVSIHSGKCYCSPEGALAAPVVDASNGRHPPVSCGWFADRRRRMALCWRRDERSPGSVQSRESLTQDSRSAVKARMFDPLRESFGERRCTPCKADVSGLARGRHVGLSPRTRDETLRRRREAADARVRH